MKAFDTGQSVRTPLKEKWVRKRKKGRKCRGSWRERRRRRKRRGVVVIIHCWKQNQPRNGLIFFWQKFNGKKKYFKNNNYVFFNKIFELSCLGAEGEYQKRARCMNPLWYSLPWWGPLRLLYSFSLLILVSLAQPVMSHYYCVLFFVFLFFRWITIVFITNKTLFSVSHPETHKKGKKKSWRKRCFDCKVNSFFFFSSSSKLLCLRHWSPGSIHLCFYFY